MKTHHLLILLCLALVLLAGCTTVDVINLSELNARVLIQLPDQPGGVSRSIGSGNSTSTFSNYGGTVTITVLPDERYRELLLDLQTEISNRLFEERASLSASDVSLLVERLNEIDSALEELADDGASCSVVAPDFSSVTAVLNWSTSASNWELSCSVESDSE